MTKPSVRATATEYQNYWESRKKVEIGWFWRESTPNFSWEARFDMTCSHQKTVLVSAFRHGERFNNQIQKSWWKVFRSPVLEASSFKTTRNTKTTRNPKTTRNLLSKKEDLFIDSKQRSPQEVESQRSTISFQTGIPRDSKYYEKKLKWAAIYFHILVVRTSGVRDRQNHRSDQQHLSTKNTESHHRRWDWLVLTRGDTQLFMREKLWHNFFTIIQFSSWICALYHDWTNQQPLSEKFAWSLGV